MYIFFYHVISFKYCVPISHNGDPIIANSIKMFLIFFPGSLEVAKTTTTTTGIFQ